MQPLNEAVDRAVRDLLTQLGRIPADQMIQNACSRNNEILKAAYLDNGNSTLTRKAMQNACWTKDGGDIPNERKDS